MRYKSFFLWGITLLLALRFLHFGSEIDAPHDWRQCDTANYIRDFYHNGIDLLHPAVCWMGASDTLALEFPLPEAVVALVYRVSGESIPVARLVFMCFFAGALFYFYKIVKMLFGRPLAQLATLTYLALPLSEYYSRAIHIDFAAIFAAHAMLYYFLVGVEKRRWAYILLSSLAATLAFVIKAPYAFYFALPMLFFAMQQKALDWIIRTSGLYLIALSAFWFWQQHVNTINSAAPNLDYILHYRKMTQSAAWYFGTTQQRLSLYPWWVLLQRGILEVVEIGRLIRDNTPDKALIIVTYQQLDCRNPKILYRAARRGWSVEEAALKPEVIERLHAEQGAQFWAYVGSAMPQFGQKIPQPLVFDLSSIPEQLFIFDLNLEK